MFVRENELVYFIGRISSSPFTDEYPYPSVLAVLRASAPPRDAQYEGRRPENFDGMVPMRIWE